jgi:hypothetical protein
MNWRQNPARVAWVILTVSFFLCCVLAVTVPLGARSFLLHATRAKTLFLQATEGTAQLLPPGDSEPTAVTDRRQAPEGSRIATDAAAKALLTMALDDAGQRVLATVQLDPGTTLSVREARSPRFALSQDPHRTSFDFTSGRLFIATQRVDDRDVAVYLTTPDTEVAFGIGILDLTVREGETQVRVRSGTAQVMAAGSEVTVNAGERVNVGGGRAPEFPAPDTVNLIVNGGFEGQLTPLWREFAEVKPGFSPGTVDLVRDGRRNVVHFTRREEDGVPNRVGVEQVVSRDVQGYDSLLLRFDLKVLAHSVPGGGEQATEYPVMVDLAFTDIYGKDLHWYQGFYAFSLPPGSPYPEPTGERVPLGIWYTYESPDLFDALLATPPARINSITVYAVGHDYESMVSDVVLTVQ